VTDIYLLALHSVEGFGPARIKKLFDYFGSFEAIWNSSSPELRQFKFPEKLVENFKIAKKDLDPEIYFFELFIVCPT
jgi:excinuclease UvrABC nuclease subunit